MSAHLWAAWLLPKLGKWGENLLRVQGSLAPRKANAEVYMCLSFRLLAHS